MEHKKCYEYPEIYETPVGVQSAIAASENNSLVNYEYEELLTV